MTTFKLTYSTMFDPPEDLHRHFDAALAAVRSSLGAEHPMWFGGEDVRAAKPFTVHGPVDCRVALGRFQAGDGPHAAAPMHGRRPRVPRMGRDPRGGSASRR